MQNISNRSLNHFKDFPENFLNWITQLSYGSSKCTKEDAKKIYKENNEKDIGFIYKKYAPVSATFDHSYYDDQNSISKTEINIQSFGDPIFFFGSIEEYKKLLNKLILDDKIENTNMYLSNQLRNFYQFGRIYSFKDNSIKNPIDF